MFRLGVLTRVGPKLSYSFNAHDLDVNIFIFTSAPVDIEYKPTAY